MGRNSRYTIFSFIKDDGSEISGNGKIGINRIKDVIRNMPPGKVVPVFWENTAQHVRPRQAGTMYFLSGTKGPKKVPENEVEKWTFRSKRRLWFDTWV